MKSFVDNLLIFASIVAVSVATTCATVRLAHADTCFTNSSSGSAVSFNAGPMLSGYAGYYGSVFTPSIDCTLDSVDLQMRATGSPTDDVNIEVWSTSGGIPDASLETGTPIDPSPLTGSYSTVTSSFAGTTVLLAGQQYAIVVNRTGFVGSFDNSNYVEVEADSIAPGNGVLYGASTLPAFSYRDQYSDTGYHMTLSGTPYAPPPSPIAGVEATSSVDQTEQNAWNALWSFMAVVFFVVWLGRSSRS